jgi:predicted nucleic acid-binding protein
VSEAPAATRTFVDTNVLAYAHDASETVRQPIAREVLAGHWRARSGALSTQVLQEFYVVATRKFDPPLPRAEARRIVAAYAEPRPRVDPDDPRRVRRPARRR